MTEEDEIREMALRSYGFGCWTAPYWFIGPEAGQSREEHDDLTRRAEAWRSLGGCQLMDCREFHLRIGELGLHREKPRLQQTWRPLMLLLMTFLGEEPVTTDQLRNYQRDKWGALDGETCVIELSGLPANSFRVDRDRKCFRKERIQVIRERILEYKPKFVVMYGLSDKPSWEEIAGRAFPSENSLKLGSTIIAFAPHPTSHGSTNDYWRQLGQRYEFCLPD